ncbi:hypothetical protein BDP27DRAFT_1327322 [Rhodocollybia butyracea]|uniref:Zn(2)-C6 fungal-type domain-containing protein n=1 Tax=Rhodocollybia butyracea TaxID=206335 RepID=A0A9P5PSK6_9AGAR|nr:hypothetical protein BDP27DRAFT_1327322 [Rhodocollybia butyracea]
MPAESLVTLNACSRCRKRKLRCNRKKPVCSECERFNAGDECEYIDKNQRSQVEILQSDIDRLQARLQELEDRRGFSSTRIRLHQPYQQTVTVTPIDPLKGLSAQTVRHIVDTFMNSTSELGFFLNPTRFRASALLPSGHAGRPTEALMSVVYLWGVHLSQDTALQKRLKVVEGRYHTSRGLSLMVASPRFNYIGVSTSGERILCCWTGFMFDRSWAAALETFSEMTCPFDVPGAQLDTPWPQEQEFYEQGGSFNAEGYSFTVLNFFMGAPTTDRGESTLAILAKAVYCWEKAGALAAADPSSTPDQCANFLITYTHTRRWIANFISELTPFQDIPNPTPEKCIRILKAHSMGHAANIEILRIFPFRSGEDHEDASVRSQSILSSAQTVVTLLVSPSLDKIRHINPVMGNIWKLAYEILTDEVRRLRSKDDHSGSVALQETLQKGVAVISRFSETCMFMKYQLRKIVEFLV